MCIRDSLGIDRVTFSGLRDPEIWVEVDPYKLRSLDLSLSEVAQSISRVSQDIPSGETGSGARQIRSLGLKDSASGISKISIKNNVRGGKLYISDIAVVHETCLLYTSPSPRDRQKSRMPSSA